MTTTIISDDGQEPKYPLNLHESNVALEWMRTRLTQLPAEHVFIYGDKPAEGGQQRVWLDCGAPRPPRQDHPILSTLPPIADTTASVMRTLSRVARRQNLPLTLTKIDDRTLEVSAPAGVDLKAQLDRLALNLVQGRFQE